MLTPTLRRLSLLAAGVFFLGFSAFSRASTLPKAVIPGGGVELLAEPRSPLEVVGLGQYTERVDSRDPAVPGEAVMKVVVTQKPDVTYRAQVQWIFERPAKKGDILLASFLARGEGTQGRQPVMEFSLAQYGDPWRNFSVLSVSPGREWTRYYLRAVVPEDYGAGKTRLSVILGFAPQTIEFADVQAWNFGQAVRFEDLPVTRLTYVGREAGAPWRVEAEKRIEQIRQAPLEVTVVGADGKAIAGATVTVTQKKRAFVFGNSISAYAWQNQAPGYDKYREMGLRLFDSFTFEWETMWDNWVKGDTRQVVVTTAKDVVSKGKILHGCHLHWGHKENLPPDIRSLALPSAEIRARMRAHTQDKMEALRGLATIWNATNETWTEHLLWDRVGQEEIAETFRQARKMDPTATLDFNDYGDPANWNTAHIEGFLANAKALIASGAPVDRIGLQCHFGSTVRSPAEVLAIVDRFAALGKPLHISELDINCSDDDFQADYLRDVLTALYSHPAIVQITQWGYWEGNHWLPAAALWRKDWSIKPSGQVLLDLLEKKWRTDAILQTDAGGQAAVRAFLGTHEVTVTVGGKTVKQTVEVGTGGGKVRMTL
ncbi:endo-1,4-beta-xylanase [Nibricoccus sp. IMCC34717]|uniref:endo-1,4-beta-xylanase n=1 Tax=Nibricoccus sp. IMCC34717 TaxID=3034021 RepID=UPI00384B7F41